MNNRLLIIGGLTSLALVLVIAYLVGFWAWIFLGVVALLLVALAIWDTTQRKHSILRNFPVVGHMRYLLESIRPEIQQYFIERNVDGKPFDRDQRSLVYSRAKGQDDHKAFGTERDTNRIGYEFLIHSTAPVPTPQPLPTVRVGGPDCRQPYDLSLLNISSMSFGSLSKNAVLAMNKGAGLGGFIHETGEGGLTKFHRGNGADLFWEIGSGYFGCRTEDGHFNPERFAEKATLPEVKGITIKLSQGAKPGLGGVLPAAKVTPEIAEAREVPVGVDCISPASHSAFHTPRQMVRFIGQLRELSGGKPIGIKFCVGSRTDVLAMCKAIWAERIAPDYIIVDGSDGGTGAAALEYQDNVGTPLTEGLMLVHNALVGTGLRHMIKIGAAGKIISGSDIVKRLIQGADFTLSARAMMMATGCIQAQKCHTNHCPVGVATQNERLMRALDVDDKANRVHNYHKLTVREAVQIMASMGVSSPSQLTTRMLRRRVDHLTTRSYASIYHWLREDELLHEPPRGWDADWREADPDHFGEHAPISYLQGDGPRWRTELTVETSALSLRDLEIAERSKDSDGEGAPEEPDAGTRQPERVPVGAGRGSGGTGPDSAGGRGPGQGAGQNAAEGGGQGSDEGSPQPRTGGEPPVRDAAPAAQGTEMNRGTRRAETGSTPVVSDAPRPEGRPGS
ncbi:FMN-binding glutamate synthase family protein [Citricoccus sp. I39-566]|uniref:FMN-binding glutamate synthase family protein n=1 Tax=Citricoccus sp. I39-566 TaxID=3073268 RepID=UPI00286CC905|nr:FMN-binding glutamate synthase family protein [Citricoccus sp. I39-566]WMY78426.1 FMN-binding glutamate synthase family protein [Citricoccus sp. I39-566]